MSRPAARWGVRRGQPLAGVFTPPGDKSITHRGVSVTISGSGIDWHDVASYRGPDRIGKYSFVGDNEIRFNPPGRQFDAVMIMDCSQCPIHPQLGPVFHEYARKHAETIRAYGARPILFMSWAYKDKPEMTAQLAERWPDLIDIDAGRIATGHATLEETGHEIFRLILEVAGGRRTWAEKWGLHNALTPFNPGPVT